MFGAHTVQTPQRDGFPGASGASKIVYVVGDGWLSDELINLLEILRLDLKQQTNDKNGLLPIQIFHVAA